MTGLKKYKELAEWNKQIEMKEGKGYAGGEGDFRE